MRTLCIAALILALPMLPWQHLGNADEPNDKNLDSRSTVRDEVSVSSLTDSELGESFEITAVSGKMVSLLSNPAEKLTVVCFLGVECPLARLYAPRLRVLHESYFDKGVRFIGINSNRQDSMDELSRFCDEFELPFPFGKDYDNRIADQYDVKRTPEVFVLDDQRRILYRGRIDDQYAPGIARNKPQRNDLALALDELLSGKNVTVSRTQPEGCLLGRTKKTVAGAKFTYTSHVAHILQQQCLECHRAGQIGPFQMEDYDEVVGWADMILEVVDNGRMPPWHADPNHGSFTNERRLSQQEKGIIRQWVADGAPFGDDKELPAAKRFVEGWNLPKAPDRIVKMREKPALPYLVPAEGTVEYQYFVVDPEFKEDKWISAAEIRPGSRSVVHHSIVFVRPPDGTPIRDVGWLAAYVPGQKSLEFNPSRARFVPAGSKLVFQQHYTTNGTPQEDMTELGLVFAEESEVKEQLITLVALDQQFEIQPHESNHATTASVPRFPRHGKLLALSPHMHFRGKSFVAEFERKGATETILKVPNYDFNWQHIYQLKEPLDLKDVQSLNVEVTFDNSEDNPFNPDPDRYVFWGDQTWEEMAVVFFDVAVSRQRPKRVPPRSESTAEQMDEESERKIVSFVDDYFARFDQNRDGLIMRTELPLSTANWAYRRYNTDRKPGLTREEIRLQAVKRLSN